jgi:hypothetical protein
MAVNQFVWSRTEAGGQTELCGGQTAEGTEAGGPSSPL